MPRGTTAAPLPRACAGAPRRRDLASAGFLAAGQLTRVALYGRRLARAPLISVTKAWLARPECWEEPASDGESKGEESSRHRRLEADVFHKRVFC